MDTQTQIDRLIELAIVQRSDLKKLVSELPQLRDHLNAEIERMFEDAEPQIRAELEDWTTKQAKDETAKLGSQLEAKLISLSKSLEATTQARYNAIMAERAQNIDLAKKAEDKLAEVAQAIPVQVKQIVTDELARFPRAGEIDQLRKEFAEPRGLNPRGRWQAGETYNKLDLVSYNGDSYVSNTDGNREKPSRSSEAWTLSAARGNGGAGGVISSLTDLVAVPTNGQLLIGNGSAFVNNTITAGTGVTVTNGPGTITIDASVAQEILTATVTNAESFAITRGQVVYLFGATGNRASVKLANNATDAESSKTFGIVSEASIAAGGNGLVTCVGTVDKLTLGSYTEGDVLYLGATPGSMTATKPYAPNHLVYVGIVERANNGNGELYVRIQNGFELDEIHDVQITTPPLAGALLMRDATNSLWKANRLTGTANQVTVTNADTAVTLSLPTAVANVNSVTAATTQNLTLTGGSTGASLVLGATTSGIATITTGTPATGQLNIGAANVFVTGGSSGLWLNASGAFNVGFYELSGAMRLRTAGLDRGALSATGNLLIGTTTDIGGSGGLSVAGTAASTAGIVATGAFQVLGGASVSKGLNVGTDVYIGNRSATPTDRGIYGQIGAGDNIAGSNLYLAAGAGTGTGTPANILFYRTATTVAGSGTQGYAEAARVTGTGNLLIGTTTDMTGSGGLKIAGTTAATTTTSGALIVAGGVGVSGAGYFGGRATAAGFVSTAFTPDTQTGAMQMGYISADVKNRIYIGDGSGYGLNLSARVSSTTTDLVTFSDALTGSANIKYTTSASSSTVGALTIGNGTAATNVAIGAGAINAGGALTVGGTVIHTLSATPASASATGTVGTMSWDANYIYICTATNTWKRVAIATW